MSSSQFQLLQQRRFAPFFTVQCLNAFNDNVFRQAIIGLLFWLQATPAERTLYASLAPAIFILPYFLFSATAGQIAEKFEKARLIRITTVMGVAIMCVAALGFALHNLPLLLAALFATGVHSTLFGPVKYAILPAVLHPRELTGGNGLVEMGTSISILVGMIVGGVAPPSQNALDAGDFGARLGDAVDHDGESIGAATLATLLFKQKCEVAAINR